MYNLVWQSVMCASADPSNDEESDAAPNRSDRLTTGFLLASDSPGENAPARNRQLDRASLPGLAYGKKFAHNSQPASRSAPLYAKIAHKRRRRSGCGGSTSTAQPLFDSQ